MMHNIKNAYLRSILLVLALEIENYYGLTLEIGALYVIQS